MEITTKTRTSEELEKHDYRNMYELKINGKIAFSIHEGEPEDAKLSRDMNDCYNIPDLLKKAYEAGLAKEGFSIDGEILFNKV